MENLTKFYNFCLKFLDFFWALFIDIYMFKYDLMVKLRTLNHMFSAFFYSMCIPLFSLSMNFVIDYSCYFVLFAIHHLAIHILVIYRRIRNDYLRTDFYETHFRVLSDFLFLIVFCNSYYEVLTVYYSEYCDYIQYLRQMRDIEIYEQNIKYIKMCPKPDEEVTRKVVPEGFFDNDNK